MRTHVFVWVCPCMYLWRLEIDTEWPPPLFSTFLVLGLSLNLNSMIGLTGWPASPWEPLRYTSKRWDCRHALPFPSLYVVLRKWFLLWLMVSKVSLCAVLATSLRPRVHDEASRAAHSVALEIQRERGRGWGSRYSISGSASMISLFPSRTYPMGQVFKARVFGDIPKYSNN